MHNFIIRDNKSINTEGLENTDGDVCVAMEGFDHQEFIEELTADKKDDGAKAPSPINRILAFPDEKAQFFTEVHAHINNADFDFGMLYTALSKLTQDGELHIWYTGMMDALDLGGLFGVLRGANCKIVSEVASIMSIPMLAAAATAHEVNIAPSCSIILTRFLEGGAGAGLSPKDRENSLDYNTKLNKQYADRLVDAGWLTKEEVDSCLDREMPVIVPVDKMIERVSENGTLLQ